MSINGMGPTDDKEAELLETLMLDAIADVLTRSEDGFMITKYILIAEGLDRTGNRVLWTMSGPDVRAWETTGMLQHALNIQAGETMAGAIFERIDDEEEEEG